MSEQLPGDTFSLMDVKYFVTRNGFGTQVLVNQYGQVYPMGALNDIARGTFPTPIGYVTVSSYIPKTEKTPTPTEVLDNAREEMAFELRVWKEAYGEGYQAGFDHGEDVGRDRN